MSTTDLTLKDNPKLMVSVTDFPETFKNKCGHLKDDTKVPKKKGIEGRRLADDIGQTKDVVPEDLFLVITQCRREFAFTLNRLKVVLRRRKPMQPAEINLAFFQRIKQIGNKLALWTIYFHEYFKETDRRKVAEEARNWQMNMIYKMKSGLGSNQGQPKMTKTLLDNPEVDAYLREGNMFAKLVAFFVPNYKSEDNRDPNDTFPQLNFQFHFTEYWYYMISSLVHIGAAQEKLKKFYLAEKYFKKAVEISDIIIQGQHFNPDLLKISIRAYLAMARTLISNNPKLSLEYLNRCLSLNQMVYSFFENEFVTMFYPHCVVHKLEDTRTIFVIIFINFAMCYEELEMTLEMFEAINLARFFVEAFWERTDQIYRFVADFYDLLNTKYGKMYKEILAMKNVILTNTRKIPNFIVQTDPDHEAWDEQILDMHMGEIHSAYGKNCAMYGDKNLVPVKRNVFNENFIVNKFRSSLKESQVDFGMDYFGDKTAPASPQKRPITTIPMKMNSVNISPTISNMGSHTNSKVKTQPVEFPMILESPENGGLVRIGEEGVEADEHLESMEQVGELASDVEKRTKNEQDNTANCTTRFDDNTRTGEQTRSPINSDHFLPHDQNGEKKSQSNFRILDLSGSETQGNWTKQSQPSLGTGIRSAGKHLRNKKSASAAGLTQILTPMEGRASSRSQSREAPAVTKPKPKRYQQNRSATKKQVKPFNSKEQAEQATIEKQVFEDRFYGTGKKNTVHRLNLREEKMRQAKSDDESDGHEPVKMKSHRRGKSMATQKEISAKLAKKTPGKNVNNAYHVDSVHLSVLNNMAPFLQNTNFAKKIEQTKDEYQKEHLQSLSTHALGMKSFFDREIQKVLSDAEHKACDHEPEWKTEMKFHQELVRSNVQHKAVKPMGFKTFIEKNSQADKDLMKKYTQPEQDAFEVDVNTFKLKMTNGIGEIINPTRKAARSTHKFGEWLSGSDLQNMNRSDNNVVHIRKNILDAKKRRNIIKPVTQEPYTNAFTKMKYLDVKINHEEEMAARRKKEEEELERGAGFRMTAWRSNLDKEHRVSKPNLLDIILKHEEIFKLKKFCHEQKKIKKEANAIEERDKDGVEEKDSEQGAKGLDSSLMPNEGHGSQKSIRIGATTVSKKNVIGRSKLGNSRSSYNLRPGSRKTIPRRGDKGQPGKVDKKDLSVPNAKDQKSFKLSKQLIQNKMEDIETKLSKKIKPEILMNDEKKKRETAKLRQKPKYQKMIEKNFDMCRSLRGYKNMTPTRYDFFQVAQQLKLIEKEKMSELAAGMGKVLGGAGSGTNYARGFTLGEAGGKTFAAKDAMAPFAHLFAKGRSVESSAIPEMNEGSVSQILKAGGLMGNFESRE